MEEAGPPPDLPHREARSLNASNVLDSRTREAQERQPVARDGDHKYEPAPLRSKATGSRWSARVHEAERAEPQLSHELDALFSRLRDSIARSDSAGSAPDEALDGEMERTAAVALHGALLELLAAAPPGKEHLHIWAEEPPAILSFPARMPLYSAEWGTLTIQPPMLVFASDAADTCGVGTQAWPLASFAGADDDEEERTRCELRLLQ
eukprot:5390306-Prymnesium_polylepis.1